MTNKYYPQPMLWSPPPLQNIVTMPWDLDRYYGNTRLPSKILFSTKLFSSLPSPLFTVPLDILEHLLDQMTKKDAFRLSQTCKTFMWHPIVLKAIFYEPISIGEISSWYRNLPDYGMDTELMMGPPVTWGINASTGPFVRRLAVPEWISEQDIHYLMECCPNLDTVNFTEIFDSVPHAMGWDSQEDSDSGSDADADETKGDMDLWPSSLDRCPALFRNLRSVHLPYGSWRTVYSRLHGYQQTRSARLPKLLHLADHLQTLELTCQHESSLDPSPESRRKASAKLVADILANVNRGLTTLGLYESESTIENLDRFLRWLAIFPKLRTIKLSLHRDLHNYERDSQLRCGLDLITAPILSIPTKYQHDTASVRQYLSTIKKINDRGRFSIVSSDCGETYQSNIRDYYGLCHTELVQGPRNDLWTPIWTWNDRLDWVQSHQNHWVMDNIDIGKCRALFEELTKARIPVSIVLEPLTVPFGALFAGPWDGGVSRLNQSLPGYEATVNGVERLPKQHFIQQRVLATVTSKHALLFCDMPTWIDDQPYRIISVDSAVVEQKLDIRNLKDSLGNHFLEPARASPYLWTQQWKQGESTAQSNAEPHINPAVPEPVWRLNEVGDLVDDLRLRWHRGFAYVYTKLYFEHCEPNPDWSVWSNIMHRCKSHLRGRLWREAEYTALLFRRIPLDFPRLTRLALYIPAALYPDHDQTFIDHALPGTGWSVKHYGTLGVSRPPMRDIDESCLKLADDVCPFIRRFFNRPVPTNDPAAVIIHDDEWHRTQRPLFDLNGEYKSMEQLLTEPLGENYIKEEDYLGPLGRDPREEEGLGEMRDTDLDRR